MHCKYEALVRVSDDWLPNFDSNKCKMVVSLAWNPDEKDFNDCFVTIQVMGADDFGLEIEYKPKSKEDAISKYNEYAQIIKTHQRGIYNKEHFKSIGFLSI